MSESVEIKEYDTYTHMTAEVYDLIYSKKDYAGEAAKLKTIIDGRCQSGSQTILEAACGTGSYLVHLRNDYHVEGFDLSSEQVAGAQSRLPDTNIFQADMLDFDTGKQYDSVLCLFSSIGYLQTKDNLDAAIANMARHTKPGGLVIVEPWLKVEDLIPGHISQDSASGNGLWVSRIGTHTHDGKISTMHMHHMVGKDDNVEHFVETHQLALYTDDELSDAFQKAGLSVEIDPEGLNRRLFIGQKAI